MFLMGLRGYEEARGRHVPPGPAALTSSKSVNLLKYLPVVNWLWLVFILSPSVIFRAEFFPELDEGSLEGLLARPVCFPLMFLLRNILALEY